MKLSEAIKIIDYDIDRYVTKEEEVEALIVFWRDLFGVNLQNPDGSYKSVYTVLEEASKCFNK